MKKVLFFFFCIVLAGLMSFATKKNADGGTIHVYVKNAYNKPYDYARVNYAVCTTLFCDGLGNDVRTDKNGYAKISWRSSCDVCTIYVNGKAHTGKKYENGETYSFTSND